MLAARTFSPGDAVLRVQDISVLYPLPLTQIVHTFPSAPGLLQAPWVDVSDSWLDEGRTNNHDPRKEGAPRNLTASLSSGGSGQGSQ